MATWSIRSMPMPKTDLTHPEKPRSPAPPMMPAHPESWIRKPPAVARTRVESEEVAANACPPSPGIGCPGSVPNPDTGCQQLEQAFARGFSGAPQALQYFGRSMVCGPAMACGSGAALSLSSALSCSGISSPQCPQERTCGGLLFPHDGQTAISSLRENDGCVDT